VSKPVSKQDRYAGASALKGLSLGQQADYISQYTPTLLQPVPRSLNRNATRTEGHDLRRRCVQPDDAADVNAVC
jgi:NADPH-dependent 7-cyano-7-deazaguanine reductase QueF-like protein